MRGKEVIYILSVGFGYFIGLQQSMSGGQITSQEWNFMNVPNPSIIDPDPGFTSPPGSAPVGVARDATFIQQLDNHMGVLALTPELTAGFIIPNFLVTEPVKKSLILLMTYKINNAGDALPLPNLPRVAGFDGRLVADNPIMGENGWRTFRFDYNSNTCPPTEVVEIPGNPFGGTLFLDSVTIQTDCQPVPEPASFLLVGTGLAIFIRWRTDRSSCSRK